MLVQNLLNYLLTRFLFIFTVSVIGSVVIIGGLLLIQTIVYISKIQYRTVKIAVDIDNFDVIKNCLYVTAALTIGLTVADLFVNVIKI